MGAVLIQEDDNGDKHPAGFLSHSFTSTERNWQVYDRELFTIICALQEWKHFIQGSPFLTIIRTDHANLTYFREINRLTDKQKRWIAELMDYSFELQHKAGRQMIPADALSRRHDHAVRLKIKEELIGLPEELFVKVVDLDLWDAVVSRQQSDESA